VANRSRRAAGRRSSGPKNNIWTTVIADRVTVAANGQTADVIVATTDWARGSVGGSERATILRVRGWMSFAGKRIAGAVGSAGLMAYLTVVDEDISTDADPKTAATYIDEDILWTHGASLSAAAVAESRASVFWEVDVKAMRKIRIGQELRMVWANLGAESIERSMVLRALLRVGGN